MRNAMLINEKDNVIVAIEPLSKGTKAVYQVNGRSEEVKVLEDIPMYHKIARVPIKSRKRNYKIWRVHRRSGL